MLRLRPIWTRAGGLLSRKLQAGWEAGIPTAGRLVRSSACCRKHAPILVPHAPRAAPLDLLTHQHHPFVLLICKVSRHHNWAFGSHFPEKSLTFFVLDGSDEYRSVANFPRGANYRSDSAPIFIPQLRRIPSTNHSRRQRSL